MKSRKNHHLIRRGAIWYFIKIVNGTKFRKALSESITEARQLRDRLLMEINHHGRIVSEETAGPSRHLFGEIAQKWAVITEKRVKTSTFRSYRSAMNFYVLRRFGNQPVDQINYMDVEEFVTGLKCSNKRINNVLVPMRGVFKMALRAGIIQKDPMTLVRNLTISRPEISPLSMEEVRRFLAAVSVPYRPFFNVAFFTGMRFGEMAALKWRNVDFKLGVIKVRETRVMEEEDRPKTTASVRDVKMIPPVIDALREQMKMTMGRSDYVFLNYYNRPLNAHSVNIHTWKPTLIKCGFTPRPLYQTRHTFATLMLDGGEHPGWVAKMMGHVNLKMIHEHYYSYIKNYQRDDGSTFMEKVYSPDLQGGVDEEDIYDEPNFG